MSKKLSAENIGSAHPGGDRLRLLMSRGVPAQDLMFRKDQFNISDGLVSMELDVARTSAKRISVARQVKGLNRVWDNILSGSYVMGISSFPSDQRAKTVAIHLFNRAVEMHRTARRAGRGLPLWHRVYGSLGDPLRDKPLAEMPSFLVIANVDNDATGVKIEKVRDLLEKFSDIPRLVVSTGGTSCDLFAHRIHYKCSHLLHVGPTNLVDRD